MQLFHTNKPPPPPPLLLRTRSNSKLAAKAIFRIIDQQKNIYMFVCFYLSCIMNFQRRYTHSSLFEAIVVVIVVVVCLCSHLVKASWMVLSFGFCVSSSFLMFICSCFFFKKMSVTMLQLLLALYWKFNEFALTVYVYRYTSMWFSLQEISSDLSVCFILWSLQI